MSFLKNHYEKILFGLFFLIFVGSLGGAYFLTERQQQAIQNAPPTIPKGKNIERAEVDTAAVLRPLASPARWMSEPRIFQPTFRVFLMGARTNIQDLAGAGPISPGSEIKVPDPENLRPADRKYDTVEAVLEVVRIAIEPFEVQFTGSIKLSAEVTKYQLVIPGRPPQFKSIGESFEGYTLKEHRAKRDARGVDVSELDIQRGSEPVVTLVLRQPFAAGAITAHLKNDFQPQSYRLKVGDVFTIELEAPQPQGKRIPVELKVVDIKQPIVVVEQTSKEGNPEAGRKHQLREGGKPQTEIPAR